MERSSKKEKGLMGTDNCVVIVGGRVRGLKVMEKHNRKEKHKQCNLQREDKTDSFYV